ncbi:LEAF RUST 10 DISEASE-RESISTANCEUS RECEPTOR-LIKE PROTEIN KINASE-like 1.2 isoform X2 [Coffea arabica]|uniref:non-specific serine/threonine protein kinase n=1 Tax=Coffea arabica TaxID=13443 RepID=A0A6P6X8H3_COFAR
MDHRTSYKCHCIQIIAILFTILMDGIACFYTNSSACEPQNCGNGLKIEYPFWIPGRQESYCGSPMFNVTCRDRNPILKISDDDYIIRDIFYTNDSILLSPAELYNVSDQCPAPQHNFSTGGTPFSYGPETVDLFFFYNCTEPYQEETYPLDCACNASHHAFAVFHTEILDHRNHSEQSCQPPVNAPVATDSLNRLLAMNYTDVLKKGFVLQWDGDSCSKCRRSGGECGSYYDDFVCYCDDHIHPKTCDDGGGSNLRLKIGIGFGAAAGSALILCVIFFVYQRRHKNRDSGSTLISRDISSYSSSVIDPERASGYLGVHIFAYTELEEATNCFDPNKELGDGGFGTVYKGKLRDGREVAVKRLYESNFKRVEHFRNEVEILTRLRHRNLVSLYGCTSRHCRELLLVYEYIPNGTIADHLHGPLARPGSLPWSTRMNIAIETASALSYLHASDVIHRDVKTNNILLDNNFCVKVADFGLSRLFPINATHVSTAPQGTPGYVDPEYHQCYHLTDKSDVFSFGVVLIELISSMPAVDITRHRHEINLSNIAVHRIQNHLLHELVDDNLGYGSDYKLTAMIEDVAELAFQCLQYERDMRPTMQEVLQALLEIQNKDYNAEKKEEMDNQADDVVLLKINQLTSSPDSILTNSVSSSTTTSTST